MDPPTTFIFLEAVAFNWQIPIFGYVWIFKLVLSVVLSSQKNIYFFSFSPNLLKYKKWILDIFLAGSNLILHVHTFTHKGIIVILSHPHVLLQQQLFEAIMLPCG